MSKMYCMVGTDANIEIDGFPFFAEEITSSEPYNRRDFKRDKIKCVYTTKLVNTIKSSYMDNLRQFVKVAVIYQ